MTEIVETGQDIGDVKFKNFVSQKKRFRAWLSGVKTPKICLACQSCHSSGTYCISNEDMHGKVKTDWDTNKFNSDIPLIEICHAFISNEHKIQF
jgi:hypothetical protein